MKRAEGIACHSCEGFKVHVWATGAYDVGNTTLVGDPALRLKREPGDS